MTRTGGADLKVILTFIDDTIRVSDETQLIWATCQAIHLKVAGLRAMGVNTPQR